ncbi:hypothetical protein SASPL_100737 [Salvia splendens]|uniref:Myb/SANT-like domain-containing protein n=1 Tax=Salvia splendens TaxID=180675 RepID=A0A8X8YT80_SALSN|nr:hypothetical protein SASPL_100737 [Salvia splendens]
MICLCICDNNDLFCKVLPSYSLNCCVVLSIELVIYGSAMSDSKRPKTTGDDNQGDARVNAYLNRYRKAKGDRTRRSWTDREEEILVTAMRDLSASGWKTDNGFRSGFTGRLHDAIKQRFPNTDIKICPHINSKISAWKKTYSSLVGILARSGVGFNTNNDCKIDCDDDQWEQIVKCDPNAKFMRGKSWPYLEHWQIIFGKDRATGAFTEDLMEAVNSLYTQGSLHSPGGSYGQSISLADDISHVPSLGTSTGHKGTSDGGAKKRKSDKNDTSVDGLIEMLGKMNHDTNARLDCLSKRIGYEFDLSKARKDVYVELGRIPGLSRVQKFNVGEIILEKVERLDFFLGMPDEDRLAYVVHALAKYG